MKFWIHICLLAAGLVAAGLAHAQSQVDKGLAAYGKGDYKAALELWLPEARAGNVIAQNNVAILYDRGQGVAKDSDKAFHWYRQAAEEGHSHAQYNLGRMYDNGEGVQRDQVLAFKWFTLAALSGRTEFVRNRINYAKLLDKTDVARAEVLAAGWLAERKRKRRQKQ